MRVYLDTEFIEDGRTIELVSIGLVRADGEAYYAEVEEAKGHYHRADDWVKQNVLPHLTGHTTPREQIAREVVAFVGPEPVFVGWYADYDWVALCQLYGRMVDLPQGWPMYCRDFKQFADEHGVTMPEQATPEHHALNDALWLWRTAEPLLSAERLSGVPRQIRPLPVVRVGQRWADNDPRYLGRVVEVVEVGEVQATVRQIASALSRPSKVGRESKTLISRFRPTRSGFVLLFDPETGEHNRLVLKPDGTTVIEPVDD